MTSDGMLSVGFGDWYIAIATPATTRIKTATMMTILSFFF
jgi:hypothetical protein